MAVGRRPRDMRRAGAAMHVLGVVRHGGGLVVALRRSSSRSLAAVLVACSRRRNLWVRRP